MIMDNNVMRSISYGLFILTARDGDKLNGCVTNTLMQVTTSPNRVSITVNKDNYTHDMVLKTGEFNVSIFSEKAKFDTFKHFGFRTGREVDKFEDYPAPLAKNDIPYITDGTNGYISAKVIHSIDLGSHTLFIADVTDGQVLTDVPSATYDYYHKNIKESPGKKASGWICKICGYVHPHEELPADFNCPLCKHPASDFEKM